MPEARAKPELSRFDLINGEKKIMATEIQKQVLQLYVGILGRGVNGNADVDQEGFDYWVSQIEAGALSIADARRNFIEEQPEGQALYSGDTASVINGLYQNLFGRDAEAEGLAYWQEAVDNGTLDFAQVAEALVAGAQGSDVDTINARVDAQATVVGADETVDTAGLTAALNDLAAAQEAKTEFLEGLELDTDFDGEVDVEAGKATEGNVTTLLTDASTNLAGNKFTTLTQATYEDDTKTSLQDADIATAISDANDAVAAKTEAAPAGATALIQAATDAEEALEAQLVVEHEAELAYAEEVSVFETVNTGVTIGTTVGDLDFVDGQFGVSDGSGGLSTVYAELSGGTWTLTDDGEAADLSRTDDLFAKYDAEAAAQETRENLTAALEDAVSEVLLNEFDGHSVKSLGSVIAGVTPGATPNVVVDLNAGDAVVYDTADDAAAGNGTKEEFVATFSAIDASDSVAFDGGTATDTGALTAAQAAADFVADYATNGNGNWDVTDNGDGTVTFVAASVGAQADVTSSDFTVSDSTGTTTESVSVTTTVQGEDAGATTTITDTATDSAALASALDDLASLNELVEDYEGARELDGQLTALKETITEAEDAITDSVEDGGLGVNLLASTATAFSSDDDVFLYVEGTDKSFTGFGTSGEDKIFFGEGFSLVEIPEGDDINDNVGDSAAKEILWDQQGTNLVLYVEEETFAGSSSAGAAADITTITLTGVDAADVSFEGGYLIAGEVA